MPSRNPKCSKTPGIIVNLAVLRRERIFTHLDVKNFGADRIDRDLVDLRPQGARSAVHANAAVELARRRAKLRPLARVARNQLRTRQHQQCMYTPVSQRAVPILGRGVAVVAQKMCPRRHPLLKRFRKRAQCIAVDAQRLQPVERKRQRRTPKQTAERGRHVRERRRSPARNRLDRLHDACRAIVRALLALALLPRFARLVAGIRPQHEVDQILRIARSVIRRTVQRGQGELCAVLLLVLRQKSQKQKQRQAAMRRGRRVRLKMRNVDSYVWRRHFLSSESRSVWSSS